MILVWFKVCSIIWRRKTLV